MNTQNPTEHIFYKPWIDKGDNIGIQCHKCDQTFWTGKEPNGKVPNDPMDITKGIHSCENCDKIKDLNILKIETDRHTNEKEEECSHMPSQP